MRRRVTRVAMVASLVGAATLGACGGGGDSGPATTGGSASGTGATAEGVYSGTLTGSTSNAFQLLVLDDGTYWAMYGTQTSTTFFIAGFIQGTGNSSNGSFGSNNARDFGFTPARAGSIAATYNASAQTISGSVTGTTGTANFSGGSIAGSLYNYNTPASLATITGAWSLSSLTGETLAVNVAANGQFTAASSGGCNFSGTLTPRASGKNVFNVALIFGPSPCLLAGQSATGMAVAYPIASGRTQLIVAVTDGTRQYGTAAIGTR